MNKESIAKHIKNVEVGEGYYMFGLMVFYTSTLEPSDEYCSWMLTKFWKDHTEIITSGMN